MQQLDIFADSRDVILRGDLCEALLARDAQASQRALAALAAEVPDDAMLPEAQVLAAALLRAREGSAATAFAKGDEAERAVAQVRSELAPAAERALPRGTARDWLVPFWAALARRAAALRFASELPTAHAAPLWLEARDWLAARQAAESIESWRRIPLPLAWATEARHHALGLASTWPLWAELAWLAPRRFETLARRVADPQLDKLMGRFGREFEGPASASGRPTDAADDEWAWFPAWCLVDSPKLAGEMEGATPSTVHEPARAWSLLQGLLRLERQGRHHEIVKAREALRQCHPGLFRRYMSAR